MHVARFLLVTIYGLCATLALASSQDSTSGSGPTNLHKSRSNIGLATHTVETSTNDPGDMIEKRLAPKKGRKSTSTRPKRKSSGKDRNSSKGRKPSKSTTKSKKGSVAYDLAQKAAQNTLRPKQSYLFHETVGTAQYLFVAQITGVTGQRDLKITKASKLTKDTESPNSGDQMCKMEYEELCLKHKFIVYNCLEFTSTHKISQRSKLQFYKKEDLKQASFTFALKDAKQTTLFDDCAGKRYLGKPLNAGEVQNDYEEYYPGRLTY